MQSKTHIAAGFTVAIIASCFYTPDKIHLAAGAYLGSILPDIDTEASWIAQTIPWVDDFLRWVGQKAKGKNKLAYNTLKHRGILTHSLFTVFIALFFVYVYRNDFVLGILAGICSHLFLDFLSKNGLSTGSKKEDVFYNLVWGLNFVLIWLKY
jgi:membrane-bound metal-dependent hydrolase YbcI (DUF457 family)